MDIAAFQMVYPELIVSYDRCEWLGENMEYYNFIMRSWQNLAENAQALMFEEKKTSIEEIDGVIKSSGVLEPVDVALIYVKDGPHSLVGLVRGKNLRRTDEGEFNFGDFGEFSWDATNKDSVSENFEAPDFFNPEDDIKREL